MRHNKSIIAVVPARAGSKGFPNKNITPLGGKTLIARAAECLAALPWLDRRIISTDSPEYAAEAERNGLAAPWIRPPHLATDTAGGVETMQHALTATEELDGRKYDVLLIIEPTSPSRRPADIEAAVDLLLKNDMDSVVAVSRIDTKFHPMKLLSIDDAGQLGFYLPQGAGVKARQQLGGKYCYRNGVCYAVTRDCLLNKAAVITERTLPLVIDRPVANIDDALDFAWAEFILARGL